MTLYFNDGVLDYTLARYEEPTGVSGDYWALSWEGGDIVLKSTVMQYEENIKNLTGFDDLMYFCGFTQCLGNSNEFENEPGYIAGYIDRIGETRLYQALADGL